MQVRRASPFDTPFILDMLRAYREQTPFKYLHEADDAGYVTALLAGLMAGSGLVLVSVNDSGICGLLIAGIHQTIWSPKHYIMQEYAYWVNEEMRFSSAGHRLLTTYTAYGQSLIEQGRIVGFTMSKMVNSPDLRYDKFGFSKFEETWMMV